MERVDSQALKLVLKNDHDTKRDWLVIALNKITCEMHGRPCKEMQVDTIIECIKTTFWGGGVPNPDRKNAFINNANILLSALKECFDSDDVAFRKALRKDIYPTLLDADWQTQLKMDRVAIKTNIRLQILRYIFDGWMPLSEDVEECFRFICGAYAQFKNILKSPQGLSGDLMSYEEASSYRMDDSSLRTGIEKLFRDNLGNGFRGNSVSFDGGQLDSWIRKEDVPEGIVRVLLHARVNLVGPEKMREELMFVRI